MQPNPEPEPEEFWGYDLGADWRVDSGLFFSATLFQNDVENLIVSRTQRGGLPWELFGENVDEARALGLERSAAVTFLENGTADFGYTHLDTENRKTGKPAGNWRSGPTTRLT